MPSEPHDMGQLNPFAFPPETKGRFLMLTLAALAFGDNLATQLSAVFMGPGRLREVEAAIVGLMKRYWRPDPLAVKPSDMTAAAVDMAAVTRKFLRYMLEFAGVPLVIVMLLAVLATIIYRSHGVRLKRRYSMRTLSRIDAPRVVTDLEACSARHGMALPRLAWSPGLAQGHAFGLRGQEVLLLHGSPEALERSWGETSRAIAFHELAHVANGDAGDREKAKAVWTVFVGFLLLIITFVVVVARIPWEWIFRLAAMIAFVWSMWAGLIRVREFYADWRASSWGVRPGLLRILSLPEGEMQKWEQWDWWWHAWERWGERAWWRASWGTVEWIWRRAKRLLRLHPSFQARRAVLEDPQRLFQVSPNLAFLTGALLALVLIGALILLVKVFLIVGLILVIPNISALKELGSLPVGTARNALLVIMNFTILGIILLTASAVLFSAAYLIVKTIGIQVQRQAVAHLATGSSRTWGYARLLAPAFLLGLGLETGFLLAPFSFMAPSSPESWVALPIWLAMSTALMWLWLAYVHGVSRLLLGSCVGEVNPRRRRAFVTWSSAGLLAVLFWPMAMMRLSVSLSHLLSSRAALPWGDLNAQGCFIYGFFILPIMLLMLAFAVYVLWTFATLGALWIGPLRQRGRCPFCKAETRYVLSLGRRCGNCGESLTPWIFITKNRMTSAAGA